ncbi:PPOX class F420-dependent oxidoreductase [Herbiconiux sp. CPCC 205716]|uniref:PPOX class F420-dependent oxidoreductase n=1 Tax=Herbiconiux gentiana TaxID=2970912 RepID=A0ABT2GJH5_9MICO|nr:PPOX class F420-dependent oxidoreductase [Herbiconiux gentiana]MCS5716375.1 PPOX class F420-dependent oxidoreductase [Herbiconiux gentiana]
MTSEPSAPPLLPLGEEHFVSLTTFRKSGEPVSTPVWIVRDGDTLLVTTPDDTGKVKRLRNDPRVELRPCSRMGAVKEGEPARLGLAEIESDSASVRRGGGLFKRKHPLEYRVFMLVERVAAKRQKPRVMLRIRPA